MKTTKRKPGRPRVGKRIAITVRLDVKTVQAIDAIRFGDKRQAVVRRLIVKGLRT